MRNMFRLAFVLGGFLAAVLSACSSGGDSSNGGGGRAPVDLHATPPERLVGDDIQGFNNYDEAIFQEYDQKNGGVFSDIFGGPTNKDVLNYLNARAKYYGTSSSIHILNDGPQDMPHGQLLRAYNVGEGIWVDSLLNNQPVAFLIDGQVTQPILADSSRVGLIGLAEGYTDKELDDDGVTVLTLPPIFRQQVLVHEARHSDCTGGLTSADLANMRAAGRDNDKHAIAAKTCGHPHFICNRPAFKGKSVYLGLSACDPERWGAYKVGAVFAAASYHDQSDAFTKNVGKALEIDSVSRLMVDDTGTDKPDMSSSGFTQ